MAIDKFCLGTVQFGLEYGINNRIGKPTIESVENMLDIAWERGVRYYDTANAYGDAEERIGHIIKNRSYKNHMNIISKLLPNQLEQDMEYKQKYDIIHDKITQSLQLLCIDQLDGFLLHTPSDMYIEGVIDILTEMKKRGFVRHIGVSIYEYQDAMATVSMDAVDYIQVPYNVLDRRVDTQEFFAKVDKNSIQVFARSPFLQGLLTMKSSEIPPRLSYATDSVRKFEMLCKEYGMTQIEGAMLFAARHKKLDYIVTGNDSREQLEQNLELMERDAQIDEFIADIERTFSQTDKHIIFPSLWSQK